MKFSICTLTERLTRSGHLVSSLLLAVAFLLAPAWPAFAQSAAADVPSWQWPESRWRETVGRVRAGRRLLPESWPDGGKVAVTLSFDLDTETLSLRSGIT